MKIIIAILLILIAANASAQTIAENILEDDAGDAKSQFFTFFSGEKKVLQTREGIFEVQLVMISELDNSAIIKIDGEMLPQLKEGDQETSRKGINVGLIKIVSSASKKRGSMAELSIGKNGEAAKDVIIDKKAEITQAQLVSEIKEKNQTQRIIELNKTKFDEQNFSRMNAPVKEKPSAIKTIPQKPKSLWEKIIELIDWMF